MWMGMGVGMDVGDEGYVAGSEGGGDEMMIF